MDREQVLGIAVIVRDSLFGQFEIPTFLDRLLSAPEFRRLSEIRLININSTTLSALSETRRYSHTLGVLRLALLNPLLGLDEEHLRAFLASIIVHDAGTPAFAHLFEYLLKERFSWDHETGAADLVSGHSEKSVTQIFEAQTPQFRKLCEVSKIDFDLVLHFLRKSHSHSQLVFGTIDFDNLDNVARMAWMMGVRFPISGIEAIARDLAISENAQLSLPVSRRADVALWLDLRRQAYEVLVFDPPTVAAQAVLTDAIDKALASGALDLIDWHYDDRELLQALEQTPAIKLMLARDYYGELPVLCVLHQEVDKHTSLAKRSRSELVGLMIEFVRERFNPRGSVYGYVFRDRGAFSRELHFLDASTGEEWSEGGRSDSVVVYGFAKGVRLEGTVPEHIGSEFRDWLERQS